MKKLCVVDVMGALYRQRIYQMLDSQYDCIWLFGKPEGGIKSMDLSLLKEVHEADIKKVFKSIYIQNGLLKYLFARKVSTFLMNGEPFGLTNWLVLFLSKLLPNKKVYLWSHGWYGREGFVKKLMKKVYFGLADGTFLYGNYAKELMIKEGFDANKLFVIHNSLNYEQQLEFRNELSPSNIYYEHFGNNHPILLFVGRLTKVKRIDLLFESLSLLKRQNKEFNVVLIGSGSEEVYLKRLSLKLGMADSVWFYGACYDEKTNAELIYNADLCVSPGNVGLTAIHTLMFGTPVVTHNDFTMQMPEFESIKDQVTGAFFEYNNAQSLAECIDKWFECNSAKRDVVRKECFEEIDNQWNPNFQMNVLKQYLK